MIVHWTYFVAFFSSSYVVVAVVDQKSRVKQQKMMCNNLENKNNEYVFADVQGFKRACNEFVVKEICIISGNVEFHELVKSPCQYSELDWIYRRQANYVTDKHHGLKFDAGNISRDELIERTLEYVTGKVVLVKGVEKVWWLNQIYGGYCDFKCVNIENEDYFVRQMTNFLEIMRICPYHLRFKKYYGCRCALSNARSLRDFFLSDVCL